MTDLFSTPASHAFDHPELDLVEAGPSRSNGDATANLGVEEAFEVKDTVQRILAGGYKTVRLLPPLRLASSPFNAESG